VSDGNGGTDFEAITITVTSTNQRPVIAVSVNKKVNANSTLSFTLKVNDADGDTLSYSATDLPFGATFNSSTGAFSWTPTDAQIGSYNVTLMVNDGIETVSKPITIIVRAGKIKYQAGWPRLTDGLVSSASLSDLDGDGDLEVVACYRMIAENKTYVCAWHHDGTTVSGWSGKELSGAMSFVPGIADIDKDKYPEIIMGDVNGWVYVWHKDGNLMADIGGVATHWPVQLYDSILSAPVTGDVDGDGDMEIIVGTGDLSGSGRAYVYVLDKFGNIEHQLLAPNKIRSTPALGDIDGDGSWEIVVGCDDGKVYAWHMDGTAVSGFPPVATNGKVSSSPAISDIDNNGYMEIVVGSEDGGVYAWNHDGSLMAGWPKITGDKVTSSPALGDIDGDGDLEVVAGSEDGYLYVWDYQGNLLWRGDTTDKIESSSAAIGDIDGDGDKEVVVGSDSDGVYAWDYSGVLVDGFPLETSDDVQSSPTLADLDKDGDIELIVGSNDQRLHIWDLPGKFNSRNIEWGMFHLSLRYSGFYQKKVRLVSVKITPVERGYVGSAGGTLFVEDATSNIFGLELTIPTNARDNSTNIEIGEVENAPAFSASVTAVGTPVDFTKMNFRVPVMIKIPYTQLMLDEAGLTSADNLKIYTYNETTLSWSELTGGSTVDKVKKVVWAWVDHFSLFGLGGSSSAGSGGSSGSGGGCFIATAAFGASPAIETKTLIDFRDKYLITKEWGRSLVKFYYWLSPPIAKYIEKKDWARDWTRIALRPMVWIAKKTLEKR
ncbi:MAG TPA: hypothetical protein DCL49_01355, partial [Candidatus Omnitrophica bacterium]|nr:hypothetical protein [Candidatus Omnitrophota bacterium]